MEALLADIIALLQRVGPWIVFFVTAAETAFFIGLLIPAEATVLVGAFMAQAGYFPLRDVLLATIAGGFLGDQIGYLLGRYGGRRAAASSGRVGRLWRQQEPRATSLFRRKSILAVSFARFISFVRTLMPWFAGMTGMPWRRFVVYDIIGVVGWGTASVAAGYLAGESWHILAGALGTASTVVIGLIVAGMAIFSIRLKRRVKRMRRVALTGNIASGKSAVTETWASLGAHIIDADELARKAVEPGSAGLERVVKHFGAGILKDGELDRGALRAIVFESESQRRALEEIVHPEVERLRRGAERAAAARGVTLVIHAIPLLFETGLDAQFSTIVLVDAPEAVRRERLVRLRGLSEQEADAMMSAQWSPAQKRERATFLIENDGSLEDLQRKARSVWEELQ